MMNVLAYNSSRHCKRFPALLYSKNVLLLKKIEKEKIEKKGKNSDCYKTDVMKSPKNVVYVGLIPREKK